MPAPPLWAHHPDRNWSDANSLSRRNFGIFVIMLHPNSLAPGGEMMAEAAAAAVDIHLFNG
jgi:hypothetical protein